MDFLRNGERQFVPLLVTLLFMRRDRVVDDRLDVALGQILLQPVSLDAPHGKNMEYVCIPVLDSGQYDSGIVNYVRYSSELHLFGPLCLLRDDLILHRVRLPEFRPTGCCVPYI